MGKDTYDAFCSSVMTDPSVNSTFFSRNYVSANQLEVSQLVRIGWEPGRVVTLRYLGDMTFEVVESINSKLRKGDQ